MGHDATSDVAFTGFSAVLFARAKPEDQSCKHVKLFVVHGTVGAADGVEFSATFRLSAVADGGGGGADSKGFGEEDTTLMKEEVLVGDMIAVVASYPCFDGVGCRTPFVGGGGKHIEAAGMREAQFLFLDFTSSLVSGSSGILAGVELFPVVTVVANEVCNLAEGVE